jgi:hypothetical protein
MLLIAEKYITAIHSYVLSLYMQNTLLKALLYLYDNLYL